MFGKRELGWEGTFLEYYNLKLCDLFFQFLVLFIGQEKVIELGQEKVIELGIGFAEDKW